LEGTDPICRQRNHVYASSCAFKMYKKIKKPTACDMLSVIRLLNARNMKPADIHRQFCEVYGKYATNDSMVKRWVRHFNNGRKNVRDDPRSGRPSVLINICRVQWKRRSKRTDDSLFRHFPCIFHKFHIHFFTKLCMINFVFGNMCSRWVPKMLTDEHKLKQAAWHA
jgi:hypothetical protein